MSETNYLKPAMILVMGRTMSQVAAVATFLLCARFLTAELFGVFALASAVVAVLSQLPHVGFHEYILKQRLTPANAGTVWVSSLMFAVVLSVVIFLLALPLGHLFGNSDIARLMLWWAATPIASSASAVLSALAFNQNRYAPVILTTVVFEALGLIAVAVMLWQGYALDALLVQRLLITILPPLGMLALLRFWVPFHLDRGELKRLVNFTKHLTGSHLIGFGSGYGADLALGFAAGPAATGLYRFGARIVMAITTVTNLPLSTLAWTELSKFKDDPKEVGRRVDNFLPAVTLIAGVPLIGLVVIIDPLITRIAPGEWQGSIIVVQVLGLIAASRIALAVTLAPALGVIDQERWIPIVRLVNAILAITAILFLAQFGVFAAAMSQLVPLSIFIPFALYLLRKHANIDLGKWLRSMFVGATGSAAMWIGVSFCTNLLDFLPTAALLPALVIIGAGIYLPIIVLLAPKEALWMGGQMVSAMPKRFQKIITPYLPRALSLRES